MAREELVKELRIRERELLEELEAIKKIIDSNIQEVPVKTPHLNDQSKRVVKLGTSKGEMNWDDYVFHMLKEIGNRGKSKKVADAIIKANPDMKKSTVIATVRHNLSLLHKSSKIGAEKGKTKGEGFVFYIKE